LDSSLELFSWHCVAAVNKRGSHVAFRVQHKTSLRARLTRQTIDLDGHVAMTRSSVLFENLRERAETGADRLSFGPASLVLSHSILLLPVQPPNPTVQCIFLAYFTPQVLPFPVSKPLQPRIIATATRNPFRIRFYADRARNPFRIRFYENSRGVPPGSFAKTPGWGPPVHSPPLDRRYTHVTNRASH
jgi:hypothetical protein